MQTRHLLALGLIATLTFASQASAIQPNAHYSSTPSDRLDIYRKNFDLLRQKDFVSLLKRVGVQNTDSAIVWLNDNDAAFMDALTAAAKDEVKQMQTEIVAERRRAMEEGTDVQPEPVATPNVRTKRRQSNHATYSSKQVDDAPVVTVNRIEDGVTSKARTEKTVQQGDVTITQGQSGDSKIVAKENGSMTITVNATQYVDAVNKKERTSLRTEITTLWETTVPACPDANGVLLGRGEVTATVSNKITTPQTIAILKDENTTDLTLTGTVDDSAELPTFDMGGRTTKTLTGFDRARGLGLLDDSKQVDGSVSVGVKVSGNKLGNEDTQQKTDEIGSPVEVTGANKELTGMAVNSTSLAWLNANGAFQMARRNWRGGGCVEVTLSAPKIKLRAGERVDVTAETVHKHDKSKVTALLTQTAATDSATPNEQRAATRAVFTLTAPKKGSKGMIIVDSVSRRGMGGEMMRFEEDIPGQKPSKCGGWVGQVTAVTKFHRDVTTKLEGRLISATVYKEWEIIAKFEVTGVLNPIGALDNGYFADGNVTFTETDYRQVGYAKGLMSCKPAMVDTAQTQTHENVTKAEGGQRTTVYVAGNIIEFSTVDVPGKRTFKTTYKSACQQYNETNSGIREDPANYSGGGYSYRIESEIDRRYPNVLKGTVTVENEDGSQTTYTWNLSRCK